MWANQDTAQMKERWPNGKLKLHYIHLHDSIYERQEFYESGYLKLMVQVYQRFCRTTEYIENANLEMIKRVDS